MKGAAYFAIIAICLIIIPLHSASCLSSSESCPGPDEFTRSIDDMSFFSERVHYENDIIYRAAAGDFMPEHPGNELATCSSNGNVVITYGTRRSWTSEVVHHSIYPWGENAEVYSMDAGDVLPENEGEELIAVDMRNFVNLIEYQETTRKWTSERIWNDTDWLYEVDLGELSGGPDQLEIVVVGEQKHAKLLERKGDFWTNTTIARDIDIFETCWITDIYEEIPGNEVYLGGGRGIIFVSYPEGDAWHQEEIMDVGSQITDLLAADIDPDISGRELYASTIAGDVWKVWLSEEEWKKSLVHSEGKLIYGMETGMFDGREVLSIASYNNRIVIIWYDNGFRFVEVYREEFVIMGTAVLDIDLAHEGNEIISLSYLGRVAMIFQEEDGAELILPFQETSISVGETIRVPFIVESTGRYGGNADIFLESASNHVDAVLQEVTIATGSISYIEIRGILPSGPEPSEVWIYANTSLGSKKEVLLIHVNDEGPVFDAELPIIDITVNADSQIDLSFDVSSKSESSFSYVLEDQLTPVGISVNGMDDIFVMKEGVMRISGTVSVKSWVPEDEYSSFILLDAGGGKIRAVGVKISVRERRDPTFRLQLGTAMVSIPVGGNSSVPLNVIAEYGFEGNVSLSFSPDIPGISVDLSSSLIKPTGSVDVFIEITGGEGEYYIQLKGSSGDIYKETFLLLAILPPERELDAIFEQGGYEYVEQKGDRVISEFWVILSPINGELTDLVLQVDGLPDNFTVTILPSTVQRLFFPLNISFILEGPRREAPSSITLNVSGPAEGPWEIEIPLLLREDTNGENRSYLTFIIVAAVVILLAAVAAFLVLGSRSTRDLNREDSVRDHDENGPPHRRPAAPERINGSRRGNDRFDN
ncbi:MAG: hypothetical protein JW939_00760 [Candidatus Thermoplasmatota archaeon]|nr:hypothetical protein [Candidatus Thermoplasmatota archaeon]